MVSRFIWPGLIFLFLAASSLVFTNCSKVKSSGDEVTARSSVDLNQLKWTVSSSEFLGQWGTTASDPSVIRDGNVLRMFYTCADARFDINPTEPPIRLGICEATSTDGLNWQMPDDGDPTLGLRLRGVEGTSEENLEAAMVLVFNDKVYLYYSGYTDLGGTPAKGFPSDLYLATSTDGGKTFSRVGKVIARTSGGFDNDAVYSPTIWQTANGLEMVYAGHCYTNCTGVGDGVRLLGATSSDGVSWTKRNVPVMVAQPQLAWTSGGIAEPHLLVKEGRYFLFFTGIQGKERNIGIASSNSAFGPWDINPDPIVSISPASGVTDPEIIAPSVLVENNEVRMWFLYKYKVTAKEIYSTRYAVGKSN